MSGHKAGFRGLGESGAGPRSLGGYKHGGIVYRSPPGAGAVFMGRGTSYLPGGFGCKLSSCKDTQCLCVRPTVGARVASQPGRRDVHPNTLARGLGGWECLLGLQSDRGAGFARKCPHSTWAPEPAAKAGSPLGPGSIPGSVVAEAGALGTSVRSWCCF